LISRNFWEKLPITNQMGSLTTSLLRPFAGLIGRNGGSPSDEGLATISSLTKQAVRWRQLMLPALWQARRKMPGADMFPIEPDDVMYMGVAPLTLRLMSSVLTRGPLVSDKDDGFAVKCVDKENPQFVRDLGRALRPSTFFNQGIAYMFSDERGDAIYSLKAASSPDLAEFYVDRTFAGSMLTLTMKDPGGVYNYRGGIPHIFSYINVDIRSGSMMVSLQRQMPSQRELLLHQEARRTALTEERDDDDPASFCGERIEK